MNESLFNEALDLMQRLEASVKDGRVTLRAYTVSREGNVSALEIRYEESET